VYVCGSGREVTTGHRLHAESCNRHRHLSGAHRRHIAVVPASTTGRRRRVHVGLHPVPGRYPASPAPPAGINGTAVDARRRHCARAGEHPRLRTGRRLPAKVKERSQVK